MAKNQPDVIFKALRLVPDFDGNPNILTRFIRICDQLVEQYVSAAPGNEFSNSCVINGILNKITGTAACTINSNGIPDNWLGIRTALINNFSDQRDEIALYNDLSLATQGNKTPQEFYEQCQTLFSTIMTYVTLHDLIPTTIEAKRELYKKVTVQAFVRGLKEPLGSRIRCMRPCTIEKALEYVQEEQNVIYLQQRNEPSRGNPNLRVPNPYIPQPTVQHTLQRPFNFHNPVTNGPAQFAQRPMNPLQSVNQVQSRTPSNQPRMPTNTQRMFAAPPPNYNPRSQMFRLPPRNNQTNGQTPMSGVQRFNTRPLPPTKTLTGHDFYKLGNPQPSNYFKTREMHMNESMPSDGSYYDAYYNYSYCDPEYNYTYDDYSACDQGMSSDYSYYNGILDNRPEDESQPLVEYNQEGQDFQEDPLSLKPK